ncbi:MAG: restriction endonuclease subunit S [Thainema sp.]
MGKWKNKQIQELGRVITGKTPPKSEEKYFDGVHLFVSPKDLDWDKTYVSETETRISRQALDKFKNQVIPAKSIMYTSLSFAFGKVGIASESLLTNQQINSIIVNSEHDFRFVYYLLRASRPIIFSFNSGIDTPIVPKSVFEQIKLKCPPLPIQKKIAAILSAYDDLIENNNRRIALLEKMAEEIYREWFVRLRFPGHEQVTFHKGIPEGWEIKPFSQLVLINPREKLNKYESKPFVGMGDLSLTSMFFSYSEHRQGNSGSKFRNNDVLLPRITPSLENGKRGYVMCLEDNQVAFGSTEFIVIRAKNLCSEYIYFLTCLAEFRTHAEQSMVGASGRQRVHEGCFDCFFVKVPPQGLMQQFSEIIKPFFSKIKALYSSNENLQQTRDRFLTRLISGKLSVEDLDIQFPPSMTAEVSHDG